MTLVFPIGGAPIPAKALHALIVGVSEYDYLPPPDQAGDPALGGLKRLASAAGSAFEICRWLVEADARGELPLPLGSVRLLVAPSAAEQAAGNIPPTDAPTFTNFQKAAVAWREDARRDPEAMTLFYFAGHGVQKTKDNDILLLADFGDPMSAIFDRAFEVKNLTFGMAPEPANPTIANTQFYFIDACRMDVVEATRILVQAQMMGNGAVRQLWTALNLPDERDAPIIYSTISGELSYGNPQTGRTYFCDGLLHALARGADISDVVSGRTVYPVTTASLHYALGQWFAANPAVGRQRPALGGNQIGDPAICHLARPPEVTFTIELSPVTCLDSTVIHLANETGVRKQYCHPPKDHPFADTLPMGFYRLRPKTKAPFKAKPQYVSLTQKSRNIRIAV